MDYVKDLLPAKLEQSSIKTAGLIIAGGLTTYYAFHRINSADKAKSHIPIPIPKGYIPYFGTS